MKITTPLVLFSASLPLAYAWGGLGHETVAFVASNFVTPLTETYLQAMLGDDSPQYLAKVATWADSFRYTEAGRFSGPFHFIDSQDQPPISCGVTFARDCGVQGCVVGAIQNYTSRLMNASLPHFERNMAAKFVIHFLGDIHQPLHDEHLDRGGNGISVLFDGKPTNLHSVWDTSVPETYIGGYSIDLAMAWGFNLSAAIMSGEYAAVAPSWLDGLDIGDPVSSSLIWATEANKYICTTIMPDGKEALVGKELNGTYYEKAVPIVELQIARAGYRYVVYLKSKLKKVVANVFRLAAWLNGIAGAPEIEEAQEL
jgi:hypothetical protein